MAKNYLDYEGLSTYHAKVKSELDKKVDKVPGKGLSTEDFTTEEKQKLAGITGSGDYVLPKATTTELGGIMVDMADIYVEGDPSSTIDTDGLVLVRLYTDRTGLAKALVPIAQPDGTKGLVSIGQNSGLQVSSTGALSLTRATQNALGGIMVDEVETENTDINPNGIVLVSLFTQLSGSTKALVPVAQPGGAKGLVAIEQNSGLKVDAKGNLSIDSETANISWSGITNKPDIALKSDIANVYKYKGSVDTNMDLPTEDMTPGDVYNVEATGMNYAWTGSAWDALGSIFEINSISDEQIAALFSSSDTGNEDEASY